MANRLANETSPYLLQHKDNPVDWRPWGEEAFALARTENKPILLSVGYSACHWCHVMAHESFENPDIARVMNALFVNVKVDREERPDVDAVYMKAVHASGGQGGWPMTVFLLPDGRPFFAGTYFPPTDRGGMIGFQRLLNIIREAFENRRADVEATAASAAAAIERQMRLGKAAAGGFDARLPDLAAEAFARVIDELHGGFGQGMKFPQPVAWEFLLHCGATSGDVEGARTLGLLKLTLTRMANGGIYDQLGGGFARYATDRAWIVPHFEKMLYDNAQLARLYCEAWLIDGERLFKRVAAETCAYILRELAHSEGGFYAAQDADTDGKEGGFYVWDCAEFKRTVGAADAELACRRWGVTAAGNYEGANVLTFDGEIDDLAREFGTDAADVAARLKRARAKLLAARAKRSRPGLDNKIIAAWNGLAIDALAYAGATLNEPAWIAAAERAAEFVLNQMTDRKTGRLLRIWNGAAKGLGYLEDYAFFINGLLSLYQATFKLRFLSLADLFAQSMLKIFWSDADGAFYDSGVDHEALIVRPREFHDGATASGGSAALAALWRVGAFMGDLRYGDTIEKALDAAATQLRAEPLSAPNWMRVAKLQAASAQQVVLVGDENDPDLQKMAQIAVGGYHPNRVTLIAPSAAPAAEVAKFPIFKDKTARANRPAAYVCRNNACAAPVAAAEALTEALKTP